MYYTMCNFSEFTVKFVLATGVFSGLRGIVQKESVMGLYKGNGAQMVRIFPYGAVQFVSFEIYKTVMILISKMFILGSITCLIVQQVSFMPYKHFCVPKIVMMTCN